MKRGEILRPKTVCRSAAGGRAILGKLLMNIKLTWLGAALLVLAATAISTFLVVVGWIGGNRAAPRKLTYPELTGSVFLPPPNDPFKAPHVRELRLPAFDDATSVWGATGRDTRGHIWVGVSAMSAGKSAHLLEYVPDADTWHDRGAVLEKLKDIALYTEGQGQIKIHSRIVTANDGWLYFASTDEEGERADIDAPPRWGGHLWRIHPERYTWQHLFAAPEGLVAACGAGRFVYALGYFGHVLYQYDTANGQANRVAVGSVGGHVSRNFLADLRGHAYVPRLSAGVGRVSALLVEYDAGLKEVGATPLEFYLGKESPESNHGIIGLAYLPDGRMLFTTHVGYLYMVEPRENERAAVTPMGWVHPDGVAYTPSLFSIGTDNLVAGIGNRRGEVEWIVANPGARLSLSFPLDTKGLRKVLLYGSISRDNAGRVYVGGWTENENNPGRQRPLVLQIDPGS
jgi:hypothetical protein